MEYSELKMASFSKCIEEYIYRVRQSWRRQRQEVLPSRGPSFHNDLPERRPCRADSRWASSCPRSSRPTEPGRKTPTHRSSLLAGRRRLRWWFDVDDDDYQARRRRRPENTFTAHSTWQNWLRCRQSELKVRARYIITRKRGKAQRVARPACANAIVHLLLPYRLHMLLPPNEWPLKISAQRISAYVDSPTMQMHCKISEVTGRKFIKLVASVFFSSTMLTQQYALRSVHPLSNDRATLKKKVTSVKHKPAGGIAMPGGLKCSAIIDGPRSQHAVNQGGAQCHKPATDQS